MPPASRRDPKQGTLIGQGRQVSPLPLSGLLGLPPPFGDALAAVIACARAAITCHGYAGEDLDALLGLFGIAAALAPAPGS